jgi:hypothetical protein
MSMRSNRKLRISKKIQTWTGTIDGTFFIIMEGFRPKMKRI